MLNTCTANLRKLLDLLSKRGKLQICLGGIAVDKFEALQMTQEYQASLCLGANSESDTYRIVVFWSCLNFKKFPKKALLTLKDCISDIPIQL